jgi:hypothetical protein
VPTPKAVTPKKATPQTNLPKPLPKPKNEVKVTGKGSQTAVKTDIPTTYNEVVKPKTAATKTIPTPVVEVKPAVVDKTFKVQIAAMKKPEWFDDAKVSQLWKIEQVKVGALTYFIMDGIKTLQQAKDLKAKVKAAGYKDAKVVLKEEGKFKIVD